jgi:RNA polymerase sigma-70 factor (ECF subfamily)
VDDLQAQHLSQIQTLWTLIFRAHQGSDEASTEAYTVLMERYGGAVHRYLLGITRDPELAADLAQDFALRFLRGDFRRADPRYGRFRNFVKTAVMNLVIDHHRRKKSRPLIISAETPEPESAEPDLMELDQKFLDCWRTEILETSWAELQKLQERTGQPFYTVLKLRADLPDLRSPDLAELLSERLGRTVNAGWVRQTLLRSREKFVGLIIDEISTSLEDATSEQIDEELMDLGLWDYCRARR